MIGGFAYYSIPVKAKQAKIMCKILYSTPMCLITGFCFLVQQCVHTTHIKVNGTLSPVGVKAVFLRRFPGNAKDIAISLCHHT